MAGNRRRDGAPASHVRIIGGAWRGRRVQFSPEPGLRPSPDRVRVTLFNWLAPRLAGARCLDLFAGTGCLGLEALSRSAAQAVLVEHNPRVVRSLRLAVEMLGAGGAEVVEADAMAVLAGVPEGFDVVFVDPPFAAGLVPQVLSRLVEGWVKPGGVVYVESDKASAWDVPQGWGVVRDKTAGQVRYGLISELCN